MRRPARMYSTKRPKIRQSWNKANVYFLHAGAGQDINIARSNTVFQQQWLAKSRTRSYHGEHIPEKKWKRLFSRRLLSVVDMPAQYLANHDGSEQGAGRGSGLSTEKVSAQTYATIKTHPKPPPPVPGKTMDMMTAPLSKLTPYMQMTFAPLERRLDTAVFRALFASSIRQARQFVLHGGVKVNGKKMLHPSYLLNPGDMFQVDPDKVMYGTGTQKSTSYKNVESQILTRLKRQEKDYKELLIHQVNKENATGSKGGKASKAKMTDTTAAVSEDGESGEVEAAAEEAVEEDLVAPDWKSLSAAQQWNVKERLAGKALKHISWLIARKPEELDQRQRQHVRLFLDYASRLIRSPQTEQASSAEVLDALESHFRDYEGRQNYWHITVRFGKAVGVVESGKDAATKTSGDNDSDQKAFVFSGYVKDLPVAHEAQAMKLVKSTELSSENMRYLRNLLAMYDQNPFDETKSYPTTWTPRPYMAPFAFVPRYLEVNPNICAAVYLRHPVARQGHAEVPTPYNYWTNQLAHSWYVRHS